MHLISEVYEGYTNCHHTGVDSREERRSAERTITTNTDEKKNVETVERNCCIFVRITLVYID